MVAARNVMLGEGKFRFNEFSLIAAKYLTKYTGCADIDRDIAGNQFINSEFRIFRRVVEFDKK